MMISEEIGAIKGLATAALYYDNECLYSVSSIESLTVITVNIGTIIIVHI